MIPTRGPGTAMHKEPVIAKQGGIHGGRLLMFDTLGSTNRWALDHSASLHPGDVVCAREQTAGRGRFDRRWVSPHDHCLTLSVVVDSRPFPGSSASLLPLAAALAVADTLDHHGVKARLKWPNDVLVGHGKIAGILAERNGSTGPLIIGIGLNVNLTAADLDGTDFPQPPASMQAHTGASHDINEVRTVLQKSIEARFDLLAGEDGPALLAAWEERDALKNQRITIATVAGTVTGRYAGIEPDGRLSLVDPAGATRRFWSGDVSLSPSQPPAFSG